MLPVLANNQFVEAGYSYLTAKLTQVINGTDYVDIKMYGGKPHVGGGVNYFPKIPISIFARRIFTVGKKSNATIDGTEIPDKPEITTFRINLGVSFNIQGLSNN